MVCELGSQFFRLEPQFVVTHLMRNNGISCFDGSNGFRADRGWYEKSGERSGVISVHIVVGNTARRSQYGRGTMSTFGVPVKPPYHRYPTLIAAQHK